MGIHELDFINDTKDHRTEAHANIPQEILKSNTVENLISQNDDLMARLKVTLRRLSTIEIENQKLKDDLQRALLSQSAVSDQMLVYKEKDRILRNKIDHLERDKERLSVLSLSLEKTAQRLQNDIERHQRYHEKIKTQVKPYLKELKEYSTHLEQQIKIFQSDSNSKETLIKELREQMGEVAKNARYQVELQQKQLADSVLNYESEIQTLQEKIRFFQSLEEELTHTKKSLEFALERKDLLENELVQTQRQKEEQNQSAQQERESLQTRLFELSKQNQKLGIEHADLQIRVIEDQEKIKNLKEENANIKEQLESLRILWNSKNEEAEKIKTASLALERLNVELSKEVNSLRQSQSKISI